MERYRGMGREELDVAYNNRAVVPDWQGYLDRWQRRSAELYASRPVLRDLGYGPLPRQRLDLFTVDDRDAPTVLFLHGGYWQWNDKEGQAFVAAGIVSLSCHAAIGEYSLAPAATMSEICGEAIAMVGGLRRLLGERNYRSDRLVVSGISTGAHLMALTLGEEGVAGALFVSGIYDLEPIRISSLNGPIGMSVEEARRFSPLHAIPSATPPVVLVMAATSDRRSAGRHATIARHLPRWAATCGSSRSLAATTSPFLKRLPGLAGGSLTFSRNSSTTGHVGGRHRPQPRHRRSRVWPCPSV